MSKAHIEPSNLNLLARGKLPQQIASSIRRTKFTAGDLIQWERGKPAVWLVISEGKLSFEMKVCVSVKKLMAVLGGVLGILWATIQKMPEIQAIIHKALGP